jgi:hypothetical protein
MASNINFNSIDETYPIAGKDNDSQGFRDNFGYIKNSLESAKSEIEDLQLNTATTNDDNDFNFQTISSAAFKNCGEKLHDGTTVSINTSILFTDGSVQIFNVTADLTFTLSGFPASANATTGKMRIHLTGNGTHNVTFNVNAGSIKKNSGVTNPIAVAGSGTKIYDFWSYDGGSTVFMDYVGNFT